MQADVSPSPGAPPGRRRPRLVVVTPGYPPARGGVEEHVGQLATRMVDRGWDVRVLTAERGLRRRRVTVADGVVVESYPAWATRTVSMSPRLLLRALLVGREAEVLHVHSYHAATGLAVLNPLCRGRIVFTPHFHGGGHSPVAVVLHRAYRWLTGAIFTAPAAVVCVSDAERATLLNRLGRGRRRVAERTTVVPNGVDVGALTAAQPWLDQPPTVLHLGRLEPYKRTEPLIRAMAHVPEPAQLVVIGDGSERERLVELATALGLGHRVRFLGGTRTADVHRWLATATVLVSLSEHEAFGLVPLEAAVAGAAVVVSDIPAHREIVARWLGDRAVLTADLASEALAGVLIRQLARVRSRVAGPGWDDVADRTARIYAGVHTGVVGRSGTAVAADPVAAETRR